MKCVFTFQFMLISFSVWLRWGFFFCVCFSSVSIITEDRIQHDYYENEELVLCKNQLKALLFYVVA